MIYVVFGGYQINLGALLKVIFCVEVVTQTTG